jgi:hypothetical protein
MRKLIQSMAMKYVGSLAWQAYTLALVFFSKGHAPELIPYTYWAELGRSLPEPLVNNWFIKKAVISSRALLRAFVIMAAASVVYNAALYFAFDRTIPPLLLPVTALLAVVPAFMGWFGVHLSGPAKERAASGGGRGDLLVVIAVSTVGIVFARQFLFAVQFSGSSIPRSFALLERFYNPLVNVVTTAIILGSALAPMGSKAARVRDAAIVAVGLVFCAVGPEYWMYFAATTIKTLTTPDYIVILRSRRWHLLVSIPCVCLAIFGCVLLHGQTFASILLADLISGCLYYAIMRLAGSRLAAERASALPTS